MCSVVDIDFSFSCLDRRDVSILSDVSEIHADSIIHLTNFRADIGRFYLRNLKLLPFYIVEVSRGDVCLWWK
jgi:hypothetical protein